MLNTLSRRRHLSRFLRGLLAAGLVEDLREGPTTVIAPVDQAWEELPWPFDALLFDRALVEERIDVFEHCVVRGLCADRSAVYRSLAKRAIYVTRDFVYSDRCSARVLERARTSDQLLLVTDRVLVPFARARSARQR